MPEGPEIRLAADEVGAALIGRKTTEVYFAFHHLTRYAAQLRGQRVTAVETRGKAILVFFANGWVIYSHNQLYGRWYVCRCDDGVDTRRQLRLAIHNRGHSALLYSASEITVLRATELHKHPFLARLGPDILSQSVDIDAILQRLQTPRFSQRQLAGLLLDQGFIAGLGNYLRAEILTRAKLHPRLKPAQCRPAQLRRLAREIVRLTRRSYKNRGIVNPPQLVRRLKAGGHVSREAYRFNTYGRAGEPCHFCGDTIEFNLAGGRKMYFCPTCQQWPNAD